MEEKYVDLWWDVVQDIIQKYIGKVYRRYERNERLYKHRISQMEKVMLAFDYEFLVFFPEPKTLDEEEKGNTNGARPSSITTTEEEPSNLRGGRDSPKREAGGKTYA
jgi:hypothetical protein